MKIERKFKTGKSVAEVVLAAKNYFIKNDFVDYKEDEKSIEFNRGSLLYNFIAFSPLKWKSRILVDISNERGISDVSVSFDIKTTGQSVTQRETEIWDNLADNFQKELLEGKSGNVNLESKKMASGLWKLIGELILWALILGVVAGVSQALLKKYFELNVNLTYVAIGFLIVWKFGQFYKKNK